MSTSLAADLEGLTLTDSTLVPSVSGMEEVTGLGQGHIPVLHPMVWMCVGGGCDGGCDSFESQLLDGPRGQCWDRLSPSCSVLSFLTPPL